MLEYFLHNHRMSESDNDTIDKDNLTRGLNLHEFDRLYFYVQ